MLAGLFEAESELVCRYTLSFWFSFLDKLYTVCPKSYGSRACSINVWIEIIIYHYAGSFYNIVQKYCMLCVLKQGQSVL